MLTGESFVFCFDWTHPPQKKSLTYCVNFVCSAFTHRHDDDEPLDPGQRTLTSFMVKEKDKRASYFQAAGLELVDDL